MANKIIIEWNDSYSIGIKVIDDQHMKLIELTNKLFDSCLSGHERTKFDSIFLDIIHEIIAYVSYHFGAEEKVMERSNYPEYKIHKQEHANFAKEILNKVEEFKLCKVNPSLSFVYYLKNWVFSHVAVSDRKLGTYLGEMKRNGAFQHIVLGTKKDVKTNQSVNEQKRDVI